MGAGGGGGGWARPIYIHPRRKKAVARRAVLAAADALVSPCISVSRSMSGHGLYNKQPVRSFPHVCSCFPMEFKLVCCRRACTGREGLEAAAAALPCPPRPCPVRAACALACPSGPNADDARQQRPLGECGYSAQCTAAARVYV